MVTRECVINDPLGLHARLATRIIEAANGSASTVSISFGGVLADARDALALMRLDVREGEAVLVTADGPDEQDALSKVATLLEG